MEEKYVVRKECLRVSNALKKVMNVMNHMTKLKTKASENFDVIGFGALNMDKIFKVKRIACAEEESFVIKQQESCGGSAANTIVALAGLSLKTGFIGKVADDNEGRLLVKDFNDKGVNTEGVVKTESGRSGIVMAFVDIEGERALYVAPGVNDDLGINEVDGEYAARTEFLHLSSFAGRKAIDTQKALVAKLPETVKVSLDPGMLYAEKGMPFLKDLIRKAYVILPSETELKLLTGKDIETGALELIEEGPRIVAVKCGGRGCFVTDGKEKHHVKSVEVKVEDATGAGDAWNAGFLYGLLKGKSLIESAKLGNIVASRCIMETGARAGLPRLKDLQI